MRRVRRVPALLVIALLLVGGGVADRAGRPSQASADSVFAMPAAAPESALSSTWYCAGATADPKGIADGAVVVANPLGHSVHGSVTFVASDPAVQPVRVPIDIEAQSRIVLAHHDRVHTAFASALVETDGGGVIAEHTVTGPLGSGTAPCAAAASDRWYFADGGTTRDALDLLTLFNPFPEDAIVDLSFSTDQGLIAPQTLQALVVPGRGMVPINVGDHVLRRRGIAVSIVARAGRLVADRIQEYDGSAGRQGLALVLGAPSPGSAWYFPEGLVTPGVIERLQIYNPSNREARVSVELGLEKGAAEPFELTIPAQGRYTLRPDSESRVPKDVPHSTIVRSENGVGVVVERSIDAGKPSNRLGITSTMGARLTAKRWGFAAGLATQAVDEWIVLQNPSASVAHVSFTALADGQPLAIDGLQGMEVKPGQRIGVRLGDHVQRDALALVVSSDVAIVAERELYRVNKLGMSSSMGIPLR